MGTFRPECLDSVTPLNEQHPWRIVGEFVTYHNDTRPHRTLDLNPSVGPWPRQCRGRVVAIPILGGLHRRYERAVA